MTRHFIIPALASFALLGACAQAENAANSAADAAKSTAAKAENMTQNAAAKAGTMADKAAAAMTPGPDIGTLPSGTYTSEATHAYLAFSYVHQGYSKPILMWDKFDATVNLNADAPEDSSVDVTIDVASIDGGSDIWNDHLTSADWFDAGAYPTITFKSTDIDQAILGNGTLTGDLTIKDVTKPVTLDVKLNKVGEHFRSKKPMFGISATGEMKRSEFGMGKYAPMADDISLMLEIEFQKQD